jgi:nitric oxide reductase NorE protein
MNTTINNYKSIYYPPGGILMWIIIFLELITFGLALIAMLYMSKSEPVVFQDSRLLLNPIFGLINTIVLLTSGLFMALSVYEFKLLNRLRFKKYVGIAMLFGIVFLIVKSIEYFTKIDAGLSLGYNTFFNFYWMLTGFHVIHVIIGLIILSTLYFNNSKQNLKIVDVEASAAFWHMCDLIWLLLFPVIYLVF